MSSSAELRLLLALTRRLPPLPKMQGVANHLVRRWYLRRPRPPVVVRVRSLQMELDPADLVEGLILFGPQLFGRRERHFLRSHLHPGDVFLDLGAHVGFFSLHAARWVAPDGRVIAVEPEPVSRQRLQRNVALNHLQHRITVVDAAVSDTTGRARLHVDTSGNRGASSLLGTGEPSLPVRCLTVPDLLDELGIERVTAAKLDLEGLDTRVLRAWFADWPRSRWPRALVVEHHAEWSQRTGDDVQTELLRAGYRLRPGSRHNLLAALEG